MNKTKSLSKKITRREWGKLSLSGVAGLMIAPAFKYLDRQKLHAGNVIIGVQTYSFRDRDLDAAIKAMHELGLKSCELWQGHVQPREFMWKRDATPDERRQAAEGLKQWYTGLTMDKIEIIRKKINDAGITIQAYNPSFNKNNSDEMFEQNFKIAQALGTDTITTSTTVDQMPRIDPLAQQYKIKVGMHNHAHVEDANQFATPDSFMRGMKGLSDFIRINLDIGHFTAANFDAVDFIKKYHDKIVCLHLKDRKKNQGPGVPFGEGDVPLTEVLHLLRDNNWPIPCNIEYEYNGTDTVAEVKKCIDYCNKALSA